MRVAPVGILVAAFVLGGALVAAHVRGDDDESKPMDLEVTDKDVVEVVAQIAKHSGKNIAVEKGVHDHVTIRLLQVKWREALEVVAGRANCKIDESPAVIILKRAGAAAKPPAAGAPEKTAFREYPIGDEVERKDEHLKVAAVWLPPVTMDHEMGPGPGPNTVHLECDIHATKGNDNGFANTDWIPYLTIEYEITSEADASKPVLKGELMPMIAKDGPHYGATIGMPGVGRYKLLYRIYPPSKNGFGRHTDPITGVAEWWKTFECTYSWDYKGVAAEKEKR